MILAKATLDIKNVRHGLILFHLLNNADFWRGAPMTVRFLFDGRGGIVCGNSVLLLSKIVEFPGARTHEDPQIEYSLQRSYGTAAAILVWPREVSST